MKPLIKIGPVRLRRIFDGATVKAFLATRYDGQDQVQLAIRLDYSGEPDGMDALVRAAATRALVLRAAAHLRGGG